MHKLGRRPRAFNPRIPRMSMVLADIPLVAPPAMVDWTEGMPDNLGEFLNNALSDCTCAAFYHALQVWSFNVAPPMQTQPDADALALYEAACGYLPSDPSTDQGGIEQEVLAYLLNTGAPTGPAGATPHKIVAFIEVDPLNTDNVKRTIADCGVAYIGFNMPAYVMASEPPPVWDVETDNADIIGGHAVVLAGYDETGVRVISWGSFYTMTWAFFAQFTDECYALADQTWIEATGQSPGGLSLAQLEAQMQALKDQNN
jgi:hypothetical protein